MHVFKSDTLCVEFACQELVYAGLFTDCVIFYLAVVILSEFQNYQNSAMALLSTM